MKFTVFPSVPPARSPQTASPSVLQDGSWQQWYARGEALANEGAYDRALRCFEETAILAADNIDVLVYQAVCLIHLGQAQRALAVADRVLAIAPNHPQGWLYRGVALHRLGHYRDAYASYAQVQPYSAIVEYPRGDKIPQKSTLERTKIIF